MSANLLGRIILALTHGPMRASALAETLGVTVAELDEVAWHLVDKVCALYDDAGEHVLFLFEEATAPVRDMVREPRPQKRLAA